MQIFSAALCLWSFLTSKVLKSGTNPLIKHPKVPHNTRPVWHQFVIQTEKRDELIKYLADKGIGTQIHYPVPPHLSDAYSELGFQRGSFPVTEKEAQTILSLPIYNGMKEEEVTCVIKTINGWKGY